MILSCIRGLGCEGLSCAANSLFSFTGPTAGSPTIVDLPQKAVSGICWSLHPLAVLILDIIERPMPEHPTVIFTVHYFNCIGLCVLHSCHQIENIFGTLQRSANNDNTELIQRLGDPSLGPLDGHGPRSSACDKCRSKKVRLPSN